MEKAPVKYSLVRNLNCLDPRYLADNKADSLQKMKRVLKLLVDGDRIRGGIGRCDELMREFTEFIDTVVPTNLAEFRHFDPQKPGMRVDSLFSGLLKDRPAFRHIWEEVIKEMLLLSHGQASVERGFSINKQIEVENLREESFVAQRIINDHITSVGGILKVDLTKDLLASVSAARQRYMAHLEEQRMSRLKEEGSRKRKHAMEEIEQLRVKKRRIVIDVDALCDSADKLADKAEHTGNCSFISQSNSMRRTMKEKKVELQKVDRDIEDKLKSLKDIK